MKQTLLILIIAICSIFIVKAQPIYSNGIDYMITSSMPPYTVEVSQKTPKYSGDIIIPAQLTDNDITYSVTSIAAFAFSDCSDLTSVTLPNSLLEIGNYAFRLSERLTSIIIPGSVMKINMNTFQQCDSLISIEVESNNLKYSSIDGILYNKRADTLIQCPGGKSIVELSDSVKVIESDAFAFCEKLDTIYLGGSIELIKSSAFWNCSNLSAIMCCIAVPPVLESNVFLNVPSTVPLNVPTESVLLYEGADQWNSLSVTASNYCGALYVNNNNFQNVELSVLPNPFNDKLSIILPEGYSESCLEMYDINGKVVLSKQIINSTQISVNDLNTGLYFYNVISVDGQRTIGKLIKE